MRGDVIMNLNRHFMENFKRRKTGFIFTSLILFFSYPLNLLMALSRQSQIAFSSEEDRLYSMMETAEPVLSPGAWHFVIFGFIGVMTGFLAFGYLHKKNRVDLYSSVPVSYNKRFFVILSNSFIMLLIPLIACYVLCLATLGAYGILTGGAACCLLLAYGLGILFFAGMFSLAALACCLTGNATCAGMGTVVLALYEVGICAILNRFAGKYFYNYISHWRGKDVNIFKPKLSVIRYAADIVAEYADEGKVPALPVLGMVLAILLTLFLLWCSFKKRPGEAAGRSMAFLKTRRPIKYFVTVLLILYGAEFFKSVGNAPGAYVIGAVITGVFVSAVMEMIYENDIKCAFRHAVDIPIMFLICFLIVNGFKLGAAGYSSIPKESSLKGISLYVRDRYSSEDEEIPWYESNHFYDYYDYSGDRPITEEEGIEAVLSLVEREKTLTGNGPVANVAVGYYLKWGQKKYRTYTVPEEDLERVLDILWGLPSYREAMYQGIYGPLEKIERVGIVLYSEDGNTIRNLPEEETEEFISCYKKDLEEYDFSEIKDEMPFGGIILYMADYHYWNKVYKNDVPGSYENGWQRECEYPLFEQYEGMKRFLEAE